MPDQLPTRVDSQDQIPEDAPEGWYVEKDGKWELNVDYSGFTAALAKERMARRQADAKLAELHSGTKKSDAPDDPVVSSAVVQNGNGDLMKVMQAQQEQMRKDMAAMKEAQKAHSKRLEEELYSERVTKKALALAGNLEKGAQGFFEGAVKAMFRSENGAMVARDGDGNQIFDEEGNPLTLEKGVGRIRKENPFLFAQPVGTGHRATGIDRLGGGTSAGGKKIVKWSDENFQKYRKEIKEGKVIMQRQET